jgi:chaperone modulatory protein CbpM
MIGVDVLLTVIPGLPKDDLDRWIQNHWIRPDGHDGDYRFADIDVARVRLILELRDQLEINEAALPVVLLLLDQVYDLRRQLAAGVTRLSPRD